MRLAIVAPGPLGDAENAVSGLRSGLVAGRDWRRTSWLGRMAGNVVKHLIIPMEVSDMRYSLRIVGEELDPEALQALTTNVCETIRRETDVQADLPKCEPGVGAKGDPVTVGTITLACISSGAAVAFFQVIKSYFQRDASLVFELQRDDGSSIKLNAKNINRAQFDKALGIIEQASDDS